MESALQQILSRLRRTRELIDLYRKTGVQIDANSQDARMILDGMKLCEEAGHLLQEYLDKRGPPAAVLPG